VKKLVAIFFLTIYTATAFGVVFKFHRCDRVLAGLAMSDKNDRHECDGNSLMPKDCCRDKTICLEVGSRILAQQPFIPEPVFQQTDLFPATNPNHITLISDSYIPTLPFKSPPQILSRRIYLLDRVFRI